jgi:RNA polymerase subunit RPABC4/transcription elongation factor Spt4
VSTKALARAAVISGLIGGLAGLGFVTASVLSDHSRTGPAIGTMEFALLVCTLVAWFATMTLVSVYVYFDAESRGMKGGLWALLIFFFANLPGFLIYLLMRNPRLKTCQHCGERLAAEYVVCPRCRSSVGAGCARCHRPIEPEWVVCPYCQAAVQ